MVLGLRWPDGLLYRSLNEKCWFTVGIQPLRRLVLTFQGQAWLGHHQEQAKKSTFG